MKHIALPVAMMLVACLWVPPIKEPSDAFRWRARCDCELCLTDPEPGSTEFCDEDPILIEADLEVCAFEDITSPEEVFGTFTTLCFQEQESVPTVDGRPIYRCGLGVTQPEQGGIFQFIERLGRRDCTSDELVGNLINYALSAPGAATAATVSGLVRASSPDLSASGTVTGTVSFSGGNCADGTCPLTLHLIELRSDVIDVVIGDDSGTATGATVVNTTEGTGTCIGVPQFDSCIFLLDPGMQVFVSADDKDGDRQSLAATNVNDGAADGGGVINHRFREIFVNQTFTNGDLVVEFAVAGQIENLAPRISLPPPRTLSCGAGIQLDAVVEDVDGDIDALQITWFVDGAIVANNTTSFITDLDAGVHEVIAVAVDAEGAFATAETTVEITGDVTSPSLVGDPLELCIWPPNHRRILIEPADFGIEAVDDCDMAPQIEFVAGTSSQPDNGIGDGNTSDDIIVTTDSACLVAERQGPELDGRTYDMRLRARDAAGNVSPDLDVRVRVPHSMPLPSTCSAIAGEVVGDDDARCSSATRDPNGTPAPDLDPDSGRSGGCNVPASDPGLLMVLVAICWGLSVRRRRR